MSKKLIQKSTRMIFIVLWRKRINFADQMCWINKHDEKHSENLNLSSFLITMLAIVSSFECCTKILMIFLFCIFFSPNISSIFLLLVNPNWKLHKCILNLHKNIFTVSENPKKKIKKCRWLKCWFFVLLWYILMI